MKLFLLSRAVLSRGLLLSVLALAPVSLAVPVHHHGGKHTAPRHAVRGKKIHHRGKIASRPVKRKQARRPASASMRKAAVSAGAVGAAAASISSAAPSAATTPPPGEKPVPNTGTQTGLPLPRFAALRADRVYMRRGPGERYPIDWVYYRRDLPMEITREFDVWRLVEDPYGQKGWVHQVTLHGARSFVIPGPVTGASPNPATGTTEDKIPTRGEHTDPRVLSYLPVQEAVRNQRDDVALMKTPMSDGTVVAVLRPGVVGRIKMCPQGSQWCQVTVKGYEGWLQRRQIWGVLPDEAIQRN